MRKSHIVFVKPLLAALAMSLTACAAQTPAQSPAPRPALSDAWSKPDLMAAMTAVADWQLEHPSRHPTYHWAQAAFYTGVMALADVASTNKYHKAMLMTSRNMGFQLGPRWGHADDHAVGQTYAQLYLSERNPDMLVGMRRVMDPMLEMPLDGSLEWEDDVALREWAWCDALFMSPPALALLARATGDRRYLELMNKLWWKTTDYLYDADEKLYLRDSRYFDRREPNGKKMFWSRGNGWVFAGLARVLMAVPAGDPMRPRFERLFVDMAERLVALQPKDGFWRASLLDPQSVPNPESSGTGFFVYGLAAGVNMGLLPADRFEPAIRSGWSALVSAVDREGENIGKLGFVQEIGHAPGSATRETTEVYGPGAFLLAGSEILKMVARKGTRAFEVEVGHDLPSARFDETVSVPWEALTRALGEGLRAEDLQVVNATSGAFVPLQAFDETADGVPDALLFQTHLLAGETQKFLVLRGGKPEDRLAPPVLYPTYGRVVPERKDDVAWENDRVAFRVYGPALEKAGEISSGIDVWSKRTRVPVIDEWYRSDDYHEDHGQGLDFYKVGPSRGCGGSAMLTDQGVFVSRNYARVKQLSQGPLRVAFAFEYDLWGPEGQRVTETKVISLDRGHSLNRIRLDWRSHGGVGALPVAVGIVKRGSKGASHQGADGKSLIYWEPGEDEARVGCAVLLPGHEGRAVETDDHHWLVTKLVPGEPFTYFAGATWSKGLDHARPATWQRYIEDQALSLEAPVDVRTPPTASLAAPPRR